MKTRIKKWGNSLALRIPKSVASEIGLETETQVEVTVADGNLLMKPVPEPEVTLEQLLAKVTQENLHHEIETGPAVGNEVW